jgi:hypothetical protein
VGVFDNLKIRPLTRITSTLWNALVDSLNEIYGFLTSGTEDINVDEVYGRAGYFNEQVYVQGKPVIKDGDPISIYQFYETANQQITEAIDKSKATSDLDQIYGNLLTIEQYAKDTRDVLVKIKINEYGNVGVRIAEPLDTYGRVQVSPPSELLNEFMPASAYGATVAANNTSGFSLVLNKGGRPNLNVYYRLGGAGNIYLKVSLDGTTWRALKTYSLSDAGEGIDIIQGVAYPYVMLATDATGIDVEFEVVASR